MSGRRTTDADLDAALRTLVAEDDDPALRDRVLRAIASARPRSRAKWSLEPSRVFSRPRAAFVGGAAAVALVLFGLSLVNQDVPLPAPPSSPMFVIAERPAPLPMPSGDVQQPAPVRVVYRPALRLAESPSAPLIDPVPPPTPIEIQRLQMPPIEDEPLQIQALTVEPLSIPPLDGE